MLNSIRCDDEYVYDNHLTRFVYGCHLTALRTWDAAGIRCVLSDLKDVEHTLPGDEDNGACRPSDAACRPSDTPSALGRVQSGKI